MRLRRTLLVGAVLIPSGAFGAYWAFVDDGHRAVPKEVRSDHRTGRAAELQRIRRTYDFGALDRFVAEQQARVERLRAESSPELEGHLLLLGESLLERALAASQDKGLRVGKPIYEQVPEKVLDWLKRAEAALDELAALGVETSETFRIRSAILSNQITGLASAWRLNSKVIAALDRAEELDSQNPHIQVARGMRALLAPRFLGHNPKAALDHFKKAMEGLADDERPRVFAAMAEWLQGRKSAARKWLEEAVRLNPHNRFAQVVLRRLGDGREDPFGADVTDDEKRAVSKSAEPAKRSTDR